MPPARRWTPAALPVASDLPAVPGDSEDAPGTEPTPDAAASPEAEASPDAAASPDAVASPDGVASPDAEAGSQRRLVVAALLGAATIALGSFGIWAIVSANGLRSAAAHANVALTDRATTRTVDHEITDAVETIFSYNYADTARTRASAQRLLTGAAIRQYDQLFALVERQAPKQKLVVTTRVTSIGVELLTGGRARLVVFANQQDTRAGTGQTSYGGAMFAVTAVNLHGRWKIANIDTFTAPAPAP
jgi:Mce-associated membrane protein